MIFSPSLLLSLWQKRLKKWQKGIFISKRQEFLIITFILTIGLLLTQLVSADFRYPLVFALSFLAYCLTALALREDLHGIEWVSLLTLPTFFTAAMAMFYFLLPVRWLTRVPIISFYAIGMYALLLTENIYNVAAIRNISLLRVAHSVGFVLTLVTYYLLVSAVLAFRLPVWSSPIFIIILNFFLVFQALWAIELTSVASSRVVKMSILLAIILGELVWIFGFWPVKRILVALFLTTVFYGVVGISQQYLVEKLYKKTVSEFFWVVVIVFILVIITTNWRGNI